MIVLILSATFNDKVRQVVDRLRNSLKLNFPHLNRLNKQLSDKILKFLKLFLILFPDDLIHIFLNRDNGVHIIRNINKYFSGILVNINQVLIDISDMLLCILSLFEDVVVAFVFLELEGFVDEWEVVLDVLELLAVELLWLDEFL